MFSTKIAKWFPANLGLFWVFSPVLKMPIGGLIQLYYMPIGGLIPVCNLFFHCLPIGSLNPYALLNPAFPYGLLKCLCLAKSCFSLWVAKMPMPC